MDAPSAVLQRAGRAEVDVHWKIAEEGDAASGAEALEHRVEKLGVGADRIARAAEDALVIELQHRARGQTGGGGSVALHRIGDQDRIVPASLHRESARDHRPARQPSKRRVHRLVHGHDDGVDGALRENFVEVAEHEKAGARPARSTAKGQLRDSGR